VRYGQICHFTCGGGNAGGPCQGATQVRAMMCKLAFCLSDAAESGGKWTAGGGEGERCLSVSAVWPLRLLNTSSTSPTAPAPNISSLHYLFFPFLLHQQQQQLHTLRSRVSHFYFTSHPTHWDSA